MSSVQAELTAGTAPGFSLLKLKLKEAQPLNAAILAENRHSPRVAKIRGIAIAIAQASCYLHSCNSTEKKHSDRF
ncbi:hypothetical protein H6F77_08460 [Microcoleus sp. FACHB-831]|nr:hypothetical protein [Microcoleus sp. FACHB-831]